MAIGGSVALQVQLLPLRDQVLVLSAFAVEQSQDGTFAPIAVELLFDAFALPRPTKVANQITALVGLGQIAKGRTRATYRVSPKGHAHIAETFSGLDLAALKAEAANSAAPNLGHTAHMLVPPTLAPPGLLQPLRKFLDAHPFERNVFGMTRFPNAKAGSDDPVARALKVSREVCAKHGLEFHLASDRLICDELWANVSAHMWGSRYGIAFFEDVADKGLNHNLLIEVGSMLTTGRRCALLKDGSIEKLPTDLVDKIYKSVDLSDEQSVASAVEGWITNDLVL